MIAYQNQNNNDTSNSNSNSSHKDSNSSDGGNNDNTDGHDNRNGNSNDKSNENILGQGGLILREPITRCTLDAVIQIAILALIAGVLALSRPAFVQWFSLFRLPRSGSPCIAAVPAAEFLASPQ